MQFTLLGVLLCTLALAALFERSRERELAVHLSDKPLISEPLTLKYPKGWDVRQESDDAPVRIIEPKRKDGHEPRVIALRQGFTKSADGIGVLQTFFNNQQGKAGKFEPISLLGENATLVSFDTYELIDDTHVRVTPGWYAAAVVPGIGAEGGNLGVILSVRGDAVDGPAGRKLLRQMVGGLSLRQHE